MDEVSQKMLGLALGGGAYRGVAHQGTVSVTSTPGEGSTFLIQIPFVEMNPT